MSIARQFGRGGVIGEMPKGKATMVTEEEMVFGKKVKPKTKKELAELARAVASIEAKPPKKKPTAGQRLVKAAEQAVAGEFTVAKKGRPKKGETVSKLVPVTVMVDPDLAKAMKATNRWQDIARLSLAHAFIPLPEIQKVDP